MKNTLVSLSAFLFPAVALAQDLTNIQNIVIAIGRIVDVALPVVVGIALLAFFWGLAKFIFAAGDPEKRSEGKAIMIWGAIAIFVMVAIFGIVEFIGNALDITEQGGTIPVIEIERI